MASWKQMHFGPVREKKENKMWLIYAYSRKTGKTVTCAWGRRDIKTVEKLKERLKSLGAGGGTATGARERFGAALKEEERPAGRRHTKGTEGNNCRLGRGTKRAFRKTCCFRRNPANRLKAFDMVFFFINYGFV
jgi:IS1 family transposase